MLKTTLIIINLLLHLTFILLQVSEALLQMSVLLLLVRDCLIVCITNELKTRDNVGHVVLVHGF